MVGILEHSCMTPFPFPRGLSTLVSLLSFVFSLLSSLFSLISYLLSLLSSLFSLLSYLLSLISSLFSLLSSLFSLLSLSLSLSLSLPLSLFSRTHSNMQNSINFIRGSAAESEAQRGHPEA